MAEQRTSQWDPQQYATHGRFVSALGMPIVALLAPQPGERILDLGCGDGALTRKLAELGCDIAVPPCARRLAVGRQTMYASVLRQQSHKKLSPPAALSLTARRTCAQWLPARQHVLKIREMA